MSEKKYIECEAFRREIDEHRPGRSYEDAWALTILDSIPAADVRPVVLCGVCELHGHCYTEDVFAFARLAEGNRFCAVGKVKTNGEERRKADV